MEKNVSTSLGNTNTPSTAVTTRFLPPPNKSSSVRTTMVSTASTSSNGLILSMTMITATFTHSATDPLFSYGMPSFNTNSVVSYSTLQNLGQGVGISNVPLQGSMGGTSAPYIAFPYGGGHIPPLTPSLGGAHQNSVKMNVNYNSIGVGIKGIPSYIMSVCSTPFSLFKAFGNNEFSSTAISAGGNPGYGQ
jgi:hypothetical protein